MTTAPEAHENSAPCQREVLRARGHLERVHAGQARRVRHEAVVQVDICVQTPPPCRCSCTAVHCHATLKCLAQGMQAACKAEARACVLHAAQRDLVLDLLRAQPLGALAHDEAVDLHAGKKGSARVSGFFFFSLAATLSTQRRARCRRCAALQVNLRRPGASSARQRCSARTWLVPVLRAQMQITSAKVALPIQRFRAFRTQPPSTCARRRLSPVRAGRASCACT